MLLWDWQTQFEELCVRLFIMCLLKIWYVSVCAPVSPFQTFIIVYYVWTTPVLKPSHIGIFEKKFNEFVLSSLQRKKTLKLREIHFFSKYEERFYSKFMTLQLITQTRASQSILLWLYQTVIHPFELLDICQNVLPALMFVQLFHNWKSDVPRVKTFPTNVSAVL